MRKLLEGITVTAELMGRDISPAAAAVMAKDLSVYPQDVVLQAMLNLRRAAGARFSLDAVIAQVERLQPDGRPRADEAWALIPRDEDASVVMTYEMAEAYGVALPLLVEGDQVAARMAFKDAYARIVDKNKLAGVPPKWFPSLGRDKEGREAVLAEAVRLGRLSANHAIGLLPPDKVAPMLESAGKETLAIEYKAPSAEEIEVRIQGMKAALKAKVAA